MKIILSFCTLSICFILLSPLRAQNVSIGEWKCYLPYSGPIAVADGGDKVYVANGSSVYDLVKEDNSYERLSKASGLSDVGMRNLFYGAEQKTLVLDYFDGNLDFLINGDIYNFPYIKTSTVSGDKNIYHASFLGDTIILSCGFGIVLFDIKTLESPATYFFTSTGGSHIKVNASAIFNNSIYAATVNGIYRGSLDEPLLEDFSNWELISGDGLPVGNATYICANGDKLYALVGDTIFVDDGGTWDTYLFESGWHTNQLVMQNNTVLISQIFGDAAPPEDSRVIIVNADGSSGTVSGGANMFYPNQSSMDAEGILWVADAYKGLIRIEGATYDYYTPNGPGSAKATDMDIYKGQLWVAPGEINASWNYQFNRDGFFNLNYGNWNNTNAYTQPALDSVFDLITVAINPADEKVYFGSFGGGLVEFDPASDILNVYQENNSSLQYVPADSGNVRVGGLAFDTNGNLWVANFGAPQPLSVKKPGTGIDKWKSFDCGLDPLLDFQVGQIVIDDFDQKWVQLPRGGGILVYNHGADIDNTADDKKRVLANGAGNGALPSATVFCLAKDKSDEIWVGTNEGVAIFYNPGEEFSGTTAGDASQPLVNLGGYNEYLLSNEQVNSIVVDGANRKWIGTNSGAFLISPDGTKQLLYFNQDNSPLLSNTVLSIAIDGISGDVFFGTDKGICSYRYTATEGLDEHTDVTVFPNPVRDTYHGLIAISGLVDEAKVKITDISGRLIYATTALGGQAVWDGNGYNGNRAGTGVYLVYSMNDDGSQTYVTKFLIVN